MDTGRFFSDSVVTLLCTVTLSPSANSGESVSTTWTGPGGAQITNSSSVSVSNPVALGNGVFRSSVAISGYVPSVNNGVYSCNATVVPSSSLVTGSNASDARTVMISRMYSIP